MEDGGQVSSHVPFSFFVALLREVASIPPRSRSSRLSKPEVSSGQSPRTVLTRWIEALRSKYTPLPRGTTTSVLRLLFPEDDTQRKYDLQETRLAQYLGECLDSSTVFTKDAAKLKSWRNESSSGCLGQEILKYAVPGTENSVGPRSVREVDELLSELASTSTFSDKVMQEAYPYTMRRSKALILRSLYDTLPATDAAFLTQIILKDLRPLLYMPLVASTSHVLLNYNTTSKQALTREQFMMSWDPTGSMVKIYKVRARLDEAGMGFEAGGMLVPACPRWGVPVEVPKSAKGRSPQHALGLLDCGSKIWAETKYDGERAQIHVRFTEEGDMKIVIFSKSRRDSTLDRIAVHPIIKAALAGIDKQDIILDAEMVPFSDERNAIDEFWRIRGLIARTAQGAREGITFSKAEQHHDSYSRDSCPSLDSYSSSYQATLHLALVFVDVLLIGRASFLNAPYAMRRLMLKSIVQEIPGRAMIAKRTLVATGFEAGPDKTCQKLREVWAQAIAEHEEGLVLKSAESTYGDWKLPWVKLKKDYIPGYGDTVDLVVIAASWDKDRARELRVPPSTFTTFYVGVIGNASHMKANPVLKPHFVVYFTASYGLSREQLEEFNFWVRAGAVDPTTTNISDNLSYTYSMLRSLRKPAIFVQNPILVELCGAGFTKSAGSKYYELRFPRITKPFRPSERSFTECITLRELQTIAYETVGRDIRDAGRYNDLEEWARTLWKKEQPSHENEKCLKRRRTTEEWELKFEAVDSRTSWRRKRGSQEVEMSP
ncbi:DNA ligase/mRNA capping enzyme [Phlebopus sp. FC_14]|nr:DNA ligase/mRNA capping enzyme [Phlebopus sp. FC_14]